MARSWSLIEDPWDELDGGICRSETLPAALDFSASNPDWLEKAGWQATQLDAMIGWTDCQVVAVGVVPFEPGAGVVATGGGSVITGGATGGCAGSGCGMGAGGGVARGAGCVSGGAGGAASVVVPVGGDTGGAAGTTGAGTMVADGVVCEVAELPPPFVPPLEDPARLWVTQSLIDGFVASQYSVGLR